MKSPDIAIHIVVACSLILALGSLTFGYRSEDLGYLLLLLSAVNVCLLAGILFVMERMLRKIK